MSALRTSLFFFVPALLFACSSTSTPSGDAGADAGTDAAVATKGKICMVADNLQDKSFGETAFKGAQDAKTQLGWDVDAVDVPASERQDTASATAAYISRFNTLIGKGGCTLLVGVGFSYALAVGQVGKDNPTYKFQLIDSLPQEQPNPANAPTDLTLANVIGQLYDTSQPSFLAGYVAAGVSKTKKVGVFGGMQIPSVTDFMDGFVLGVKKYNEGKAIADQVTVEGWDEVSRTGQFVGNFYDTNKAKTISAALLDGGADIVMAVAGQLGSGTGEEIVKRRVAGQSQNGPWYIGVDSDWTLTNPGLKPATLTSVLKKMDVSIVAVAKDIRDGKFTGGTKTSDMKASEVDISPFYDNDGYVPQAVKDALPTLRDQIKSGTLKTKP